MYPTWICSDLFYANFGVANTNLPMKGSDKKNTLGTTTSSNKSDVEKSIIEN